MQRTYLRDPYIQEWCEAVEISDWRVEIPFKTLKEILGGLIHYLQAPMYYFVEGATLSDYYHFARKTSFGMIDLEPIRELVILEDRLSGASTSNEKITCPSWRIVRDLFLIIDEICDIATATNHDTPLTTQNEDQYVDLFEERGGREKIAALINGVPLEDIIGEIS